jgi:hypothetical protein
MKTFLVEWRIEIDAETPELAAARALAIQRNAQSDAVVFDVYEADNGEKITIDLNDQTGNADALVKPSVS